MTDQSIIYCKLFTESAVQWYSVEAAKFTFDWIQQRLTHDGMVEIKITYDDLSGEQSLLSSEQEFLKMREKMDKIGAQMVALRVIEGDVSFIMNLKSLCKIVLNSKGDIHPFKVSNIKVKRAKSDGALSMSCAGELGYQQVELPTDEYMLTKLTKSESAKCAWISKENWDVFFMEFTSDAEAEEFYERTNKLLSSSVGASVVKS